MQAGVYAAEKKIPFHVINYPRYPGRFDVSAQESQPGTMVVATIHPDGTVDERPVMTTTPIRETRPHGIPYYNKWTTIYKAPGGGWFRGWDGEGTEAEAQDAANGHPNAVVVPVSLLSAMQIINRVPTEREARPDVALRSTLLLTIGFLEQLKDRFSNDGSNDFHWPKWVTPEYHKLLTQRTIAETRNPDEYLNDSCVQNTSVVYGLINHLKELAGPPP